MKRPTARPRVVLDTNVVLSALLFTRGRLTRLRHAWQGGEFQALVSRDTAGELIRVLTYPRFRLSADEQRELLADYLPYCKTVRISDPPPATPSCPDKFDVPFLQLAVAGKATALVTGDQHLLVLAGEYACPIVSAASFIMALTP